MDIEGHVGLHRVFGSRTARLSKTFQSTASRTGAAPIQTARFGKRIAAHVAATATTRSSCDHNRMETPRPWLPRPGISSGRLTRVVEAAKGLPDRNADTTSWRSGVNAGSEVSRVSREGTTGMLVAAASVVRTTSTT